MTKAEIEVRAQMHEAACERYRAALQRIVFLRAAGDVDAATGTRALVEQMERIAIGALNAEQVPA